MYKKYNYKGVLTSIIRLADSASIPIEPANRDYQEYLEWIAEGNTPEAAD
jgi:hypothetical protein